MSTTDHFARKHVNYAKHVNYRKWPGAKTRQLRKTGQLRKVARSENTSTMILKAMKTRRHGLNLDSLHFLAQFKKILGIRRFMVFRS